MEYLVNTAKLKHIVAVDQLGSVSAAAESRHVTQSTVTKSVTEMEGELGYKLFERHARGMITTEAGREFVDRLDRVLGDLNQLMQDAKSGHRLEDRLFRVGIAPPALQGLLTKAICNVTLSPSQPKVHINAGPNERIQSMLRRGDVDIMFAPSTQLRLSDEYHQISVNPFHIMLFVRQGHPLSTKRDIGFNDLALYPFIAADMMNPYAETMRKMAEEQHEHVSNLFHIIEYFPTVAKIVQSSNVVGSVHEEYARTEKFQRRFSILDTPPSPKLAFTLAYPKQSPKQKIIDTFISGLPTEEFDTWL